MSPKIDQIPIEHCYWIIGYNNHERWLIRNCSPHTPNNSLAIGRLSATANRPSLSRNAKGWNYTTDVSHQRMAINDCRLLTVV